MAIHDVVTVSSNFDNTSSSSPMKNVQLIERDRWNAHTMFPTNTPAEVWTAAFVGNGGNHPKSSSNVVWSGGDDMKLKIWDTRATLRPMLSYHSLFDAGITCISPHPKQDHIVAVGSCTYCCFSDLHCCMTMQYIHNPSNPTSHVLRHIYLLFPFVYNVNR